MSWHLWVNELRNEPLDAVNDLLRGAADITPFERVSSYEFLLAILPQNTHVVARINILGGATNSRAEDKTLSDLSDLLDNGLTSWFIKQRELKLPSGRKLSGYVRQVSEALQWLLYFRLPKTRFLLQNNRVQWINWLKKLTLSAYLDPEFDYWQALSVFQTDDQLQFYWQAFISEAGRVRSGRYLNLGLLALAKLPLSEDDSLRNIRLQIQALVNRYLQRKHLGSFAQTQLVELLESVRIRNPSLNKKNYKTLLTDLLSPLGENMTLSVLSSLGLNDIGYLNNHRDFPGLNKINPPGNTEDTLYVVDEIKYANSKLTAWSSLCREMDRQEKYLHQSGDSYHFVRVLDQCARTFMDKHSINDPEIEPRLFQWIYQSLCLDSDEPRRWMLWELALRTAGQLRRAEWVLWEMTRRFPEQVHCRVELARFLTSVGTVEAQKKAHTLLNQVLTLDPDNLHAYSVLVQLSMVEKDWSKALEYAQKGLNIDSSDSVSALHLAQAYSQRNEPGDLQTAIEHLERFIKHNHNQPLENYLNKLRRHSGSSSYEKELAPKRNETESISLQLDNEKDPAWKAFAESLSSYLLRDGQGVSFNKEIKILPFPQALQDAIFHNDWSLDIHSYYDPDVLQEFPLEVKLWDYLYVKHTKNQALHDVNKIKDEISRQIILEIDYTTSKSSEFWSRYLRSHLAEINVEGIQGIENGKEWLSDLLDRHQPLPPPVFA